MLADIDHNKRFRDAYIYVIKYIQGKFPSAKIICIIGTDIAGDYGASVEAIAQCLQSAEDLQRNPLFVSIAYEKLFLLAALLFPLAVAAQIPIDQDWARFSRYEAENAQVKEQPVAVLFGDSITNNWAKDDNAWLQEHHFLGRGIGGQTTLQMLARFRPDVIELKPDYAVILAGINDIARNTGYITVEHTFGNLVSLVELAQANSIVPVMCTLLPAAEIGWRKELGDPRPFVDSLNALIRSYAAEHNILLVDYFSVMKDENNALKAAYARDAVHPNLAGYKVMEQALMDVLAPHCVN